MFAMDFRSDGVAYAVGQDGAILRSTDHGGTWSKVETGAKAILLGVRSDPNGWVYVTGMHDMLVSSDDGKSWAHVASEDVTSAWYQGLGHGSADSPMVMVGHSGRIVRVGGG